MIDIPLLPIGGAQRREQPIGDSGGRGGRASSIWRFSSTWRKRVMFMWAAAVRKKGPRGRPRNRCPPTRPFRGRSSSTPRWTLSSRSWSPQAGKEEEVRLRTRLPAGEAESREFGRPASKSRETGRSVTWVAASAGWPAGRRRAVRPGASGSHVTVPGKAAHLGRLPARPVAGGEDRCGLWGETRVPVTAQPHVRRAHPLCAAAPRQQPGSRRTSL